jgi:hypothetical protein
MGKKRKIYELKLYTDDDTNIFPEIKFKKETNGPYTSRDLSDILDIAVYFNSFSGCRNLLKRLYGYRFAECIKFDVNLFDTINKNLDLGAIYYEIMIGDLANARLHLASQQWFTNDLNLRNLNLNSIVDLDTFEKELLKIAKMRFDPYFDPYFEN